MVEGDGRWMPRAEYGDAELVVKIGSDVKVYAEGDGDGPPVVCIQAGNWQVLFYPYSWAEGNEPTQAEADRASDVVMAFSQWRNWIYERVRAARPGDTEDSPPTMTG